MKTYIIERRKTVGAFKTIALTYNLDKAKEIFEEAKKNEGFGQGYKEKLVMTNAEKKKYPDVVEYAKVGGSHYNITLRIRGVEAE